MTDRTPGLPPHAPGLSARHPALAGRLAGRLRRVDPLAGRVKLTKGDFAAALLSGIFAPRRR